MSRAAWGVFRRLVGLGATTFEAAAVADRLGPEGLPGDAEDAQHWGAVLIREVRGDAERARARRSRFEAACLDLPRRERAERPDWAALDRPGLRRPEASAPEVVVVRVEAPRDHRVDVVGSVAVGRLGVRR